MARVRVQPHMMASTQSVKWSGWQLATDSHRQPLGPLLEGWDYDQGVRIGTSPEIKLEELMDSTGLDDPSDIHVIATVDCSSTSRRFISQVPVDEYVSAPDRFLEVRVPAGAVALELKQTCHLALMSNREQSNNRATLRGSRLAESPTVRLVLEGDASRFPTEAVSFADLRWEPAAWSVRVDLDDMNEAFPGAVRLVLNTDHPVGVALAAMEPKTYGALGSNLRIDIVRAVLIAAIEQVGRRGIADGNFDEESFGWVAEQMSSDYFGMGLAALAQMKSADNARFERVLQSSLGMDVSFR